MKIDLEYYNRFPTILKNALVGEKVSFHDNMKQEYSELVVYRAVRYNTTKQHIDKTDFLSNIERKQTNPTVVADENDIEDYGCSCFQSLEKMTKLTVYPTKNKAIAKGKIKKQFGPINIAEESTHVNLFLYNKIDPSNEFEVNKK